MQAKNRSFNQALMQAIETIINQMSKQAYQSNNQPSNKSQTYLSYLFTYFLIMNALSVRLCII
jgi:F0F1-type ATP synthase membrane subunit a